METRLSSQLIKSQVNPHPAHAWYRVGNFFDEKPPYIPVMCQLNPTISYLWQKVSFRNPVMPSVLSKINVEKHSDGKIILTLMPSPFLENEFSCAYKLFLSKNEVQNWGSCTVEIRIRINLMMTNLDRLFNYLNQTYENNEFSNELRAELRQLVLGTGDTHIIPAREYDAAISLQPSLTPLIRLARLSFTKHYAEIEAPKIDLTSDALVKYISGRFTNGNLSQVKFIEEYLTSGVDPNEEDATGNSPLSYLVCLPFVKNVKIIELLLSYGSDPFRRPHKPCWHNESAFEAAKSYGDPKVLALIINNYSKPGKIISTPHAKPKSSIKYSLMHGEKKNIYSLFCFSNNITIITRIIKTAELNASEQENLFAIFSKDFETANQQQNLRQIFADGLLGEDKLVEIIYNQDEQCIGFNLFEIIKLKRIQKHLVVHCVYALVAPAYRGYGFMNFLSFRLGFSLQSLNKDWNVGIFYSSIHYNSFRLAKNLYMFPKFQSLEATAIVNEIIEIIFNNEAVYQHNVLTCYVEEELRIKGTLRATNNPDVHEKLFNHMRDITESPTLSQAPRAVPIFFYANTYNRDKLCELANEIGMNFIQHIKSLSQLVLSMMDDFLVIDASVTNKTNHTTRYPSRL